MPWDSHGLLSGTPDFHPTPWDHCIPEKLRHHTISLKYDWSPSNGYVGVWTELFLFLCQTDLQLQPSVFIATDVLSAMCTTVSQCFWLVCKLLATDWLCDWRNWVIFQWMIMIGQWPANGSLVYYLLAPFWVPVCGHDWLTVWHRCERSWDLNGPKHFFMYPCCHWLL